METTVKIYKVKCVRSPFIHEQGTWLDLYPWRGDDTEYIGYDDGGTDYILPEGYDVRLNNTDMKMIYNSDSMPCAIINHYGSPALAINNDTILLKK